MHGYFSSQVLTILRAEHWPSFDQSELEVLERRILDEAAELFGEIDRQNNAPSCIREFHRHLRSIARELSLR